MTRITIVGNCSAQGIATAVKLMSPGSLVKGISIATFDTTDPAAVRTLLNDFDLAFPFSEIGNYGLVDEKIKECSRSFSWPSIVFAGFHPDVCYFGIDGKTAVSCLGAYNSRIVAFAYGHELSADDTASLFNSLTYGLLGYFDAYAMGKEIFLDSARQHNLNLEQEFASWEQSGVFMHTPNHPSPRVMNDIARALMRLAGIDVELEINHHADTSDYLSDGVIWPVYPELAKRIGVEGSLSFKVMSQRGGRQLSLDEFVSECFDEYREAGFTPQRFRDTGLYLDCSRKLGFQ